MERIISYKNNQIIISDEKIEVGDKVYVTLEHDPPSVETVKKIQDNLIYTNESRKNWIKNYQFIEVPYGIFKIKKTNEN